MNTNFKSICLKKRTTFKEVEMETFWNHMNLMVISLYAAYLLQAVRAAGKCDTVFKGFSNCLLRLGENMANYPQELDENENLQTICT